MTPTQVLALAKRWAGLFISKNTLGSHLRDDLTQEAAIAILKAIERHRPSKGMPLEAYARMWAFALMRKHMNSQGSAVSFGARQPIAASLVAPKEDRKANEFIDDRQESGHAHELVVAREALARASNPRQYAMVSMRIEGHGLEEIGAAFGVSRETVRQELVTFGEDMIA